MTAADQDRARLELTLADYRASGGATFYAVDAFDRRMRATSTARIRRALELGDRIASINLAQTAWHPGDIRRTAIVGMFRSPADDPL